MAKSSKGYHQTEWKKLPNFECDTCPFASLDENKVLLHVARRHSGQLAPPEPAEFHDEAVAADDDDAAKKAAASAASPKSKGA